ncbi:hypothetical protein BJ170DRAFT_594036 [Xylariales sp. AK1849]|nr:hypothetical protein BJ170DRAFT_594036 [Xylariales sp. AK1849]
MTDKLPQEAEAELRSHFTNHNRFEYEGPLGAGSYGITAKVKDKKKGSFKRLAVKRAFGPDSEYELRNEIKYLSSYRGAMHIVQLVAFRDRSYTPTLTETLANRLLLGGKYLNDLPGPTMVLESLENGNLARLIQRASASAERIPNRMLWAIFLCLIRACVGIAYPPKGGNKEPVRLEGIPTDGRAPATTSHRDFRGENSKSRFTWPFVLRLIKKVVIGDAEASPEHFLMPVVKLIDFGLVEEVGIGAFKDPLQGVRQNLLSAARYNVPILWNRPSRFEGIATYATAILKEQDYPYIDKELRHLHARSLARGADQRPGLAEMLQVTQNAVLTKTADSFRPNEASETDSAIVDLLKRLIFDASISSADEAQSAGSDYSVSSEGHNIVQPWEVV